MFLICQAPGLSVQFEGILTEGSGETRTLVKLGLFNLQNLSSEVVSEFLKEHDLWEI